MTVSGTYTPRGLYISTNPYADIPAGALVTAENVVHRRRGLIEPRPGYRPVILADDEVDEIFPFDDDLALLQKPSGIPQIQWRSDASIAILTGQTFEQGRTFSAQARGNLYINGETDTIKVTNSQATTFAIAGIEGPGFIRWESDVVGSGLSANSDIRVAATLERTDVNEVIVTSVPSSSFIFQNLTGAAVTPTYRIFLPPGAMEGDIMRLFKSEEVATDTTPSAQMLLTQEAEVTSTDISNGYVEVDDDTATDDRGATIYTAPSRGGISGANDRPPVCKDIAVFKGSLFFANARQPHQATPAWEASGELLGERLTGIANGIGIRAVTGTATSGSAVMTAVADTTGIQEGMVYFTATSARWPPFAVVVSTTANTLTLDRNATSSGAEAGTAVDSIAIDGIVYAAHTGIQTIQAVNVGVDSAGVPLNDNGGVPDPNVFATLLSAAKDGTSPSSGAGPVKINLERITGVDTAFAIHATHGDEFTPIVPLPGTGAGLDSTADTRPNGLYWSKNLQPEHVPLLNFVEIGDGTEIQRIIPARDALWVFKKDGIFRLTGNGAGNTAADADWRVDPFDRSRFLATIKSPAVLDDVVFAWTNRGVAMISDVGVVDIGQDEIQGAISLDQRLNIEDSDSNVFHAWGIAHRTHNEYWFRPGRTVAAGTVYVFNVRNKAWTTLELPDPMVAAAYRPDTSESVLAGDVTGDFDLWEEKNTAIEAFGFADVELATFNTIAANGMDITITTPGTYTPTVGDCAFFGDTLESRTVSAVASPTEYTVSAPFDVTGTGKFFISASPVTQTIEYQWHAQGNPGMAANYYLVTWAFSRFLNIPDISYDFITPLSDTRVTQTRVLPPETGTVFEASSAPFELRAYVDIDHSRTTQIRPRIQINAACGFWQHAGIQYISTDYGEKVDQR